MRDDRSNPAGYATQDVDFLPREYRQTDVRRKRAARRVFAAAAGVAVVAGLACSQQYRARRLKTQLALREPAREAAVEAQEALGELQSRLQRLQADADLVTYLRHPWPRTRIVAAILGPLPGEITFEQLAIRREDAGRQRAERRLPNSERDEGQQQANLPPAARDVKALRADFDSRRTIVTITGVTSESGALHEYLSALGRHELFLKSQLQSIEADPRDPAKIGFHATLVVRPGYGQPKGPGKPTPQPDRPTGEPAGQTARSTVPASPDPKHALFSVRP